MQVMIGSAMALPPRVVPPASRHLDAPALSSRGWGDDQGELAAWCAKLPLTGSRRQALRSTEIPALVRFPGALADHCIGGRYAGSARSEGAQLSRTINEPLGDQMDDQAFAFYSAMHFQELCRHHDTP